MRFQPMKASSTDGTVHSWPMTFLHHTPLTIRDEWILQQVVSNSWSLFLLYILALNG